MSGNKRIVLVGHGGSCANNCLKNEISNLLKEQLVNHTHNFIEAKDGSNDKICSLCGVRAMQAFAYMEAKK